MKLMRTEDAVGQVCAMTSHKLLKKALQRMPYFERPYYYRGRHTGTFKCGKDSIYIWENNENMLHENDAARSCMICANEHMTPSEIKRKIELIVSVTVF